MRRFSNISKNKIGKWATILATIITITAPVVSFIQDKIEERRDRRINDKRTILKKEIREKISIIEHDFHPETVNSNIDTIALVSAIKKFQNSALDLCALWKIANDDVDYDKFIQTKELDKFSSTIQNDINNLQKYGEKTSSVVNDMMSVVIIINCDSVSNAHYAIPNISNYYEVLNKIEIKNNKYNNISKDLEKLASNILQKQLRQESIRRELKQLSKLVKQLKDVETLEFDSELMDLIIKTNTANSVLLRNTGT